MVLKGGNLIRFLAQSEHVPPSTSSFQTTDSAAWAWFAVSMAQSGDTASIQFYNPQNSDPNQHFVVPGANLSNVRIFDVGDSGTVLNWTAELLAGLDWVSLGHGPTRQPVASLNQGFAVPALGAAVSRTSTSLTLLYANSSTNNNAEFGIYDAQPV